MHTKLLKSQKNEVFTIIKNTNLVPTEFNWSEVQTRSEFLNGKILIEQLTHIPTNYYFAFDVSSGLAFPRYFPSNDSLREMTCERHVSWKGVIQEFKKWILIVHREHSEQDFWEFSQNDKKLVVKEIDDLENIPFTSAEQQRLSSAINEIRAYLLTGFSHTETQLKLIEARLQHLEDASRRLGRKDWITLAVGTLVNIVVGVALAPDAARELWRAAGSLFGWIVGDVPLIP